MKVPTSAALLVAVLALTQSVNGDGCSGHGRKPEGSTVCQCDNARPAVGELGWTGAECDLRVLGASANGSDLADGCRQEHCDQLEPDEWFCYHVALPWKGPAGRWNYLTMQLARTSEDPAGDPDLYGMFYGGAAAQEAFPSRQTYSYSFRETSSASRGLITKRVAKTDFAYDDYDGVYICVKAYGSANTSYAVRAISTICPSDFAPDGTEILCSSRVDAPESEQHFSECTPDGQCLCRAQWAKPLPEVYHDLGFEDCSASVVKIPNSDLSTTKSYVQEHQVVPAKAWSFYAFNVTEQDYQIVVNLAAEEDSQCKTEAYFELYLQYGQPPGWHADQWAFRPSWDYMADDRDLEVKFDRTSDTWQTGTWYAGINGDDAMECKFTLSINKFDCPLNCSGRGRCIHNTNGTHTCLCDEHFLGEDCSSESAGLQYGRPVIREETAFEYEYFHLPRITEAQIKNSVELVLAASFSSSEGYSEWVAARPELLLIKSMQNGDHPTNTNFTFKQAMERQNEIFQITVCPSQLQHADWRAAIFNPMRLYKIAYNLTLSKQAFCLNDCSGHGTCSEDGECLCHEGWQGGDCSANPAATCVQGARRPTHQTGCWQQCVCGDDPASCKFADECVAFTTEDFGDSGDACSSGELLKGAKSTRSEGIFVGGQCVQSSEASSRKSSAGLHFLYVLLLLVTGALMGVGGFVAWQTGAVSMLLDRIPWLSSRRANANNLLYSELSMDTNNTGF